MSKQIGKLARAFCHLELELEVLKSNAGFYLGTKDEMSFPVSRESEEYFESFDDAELALKDGNWTQRIRP